MSKKKKFKNDIVYSTADNFVEEVEKQKAKTLPPEKQLLYIEKDRKKRKGKVVIVITNFVGQTDDLKALGKELKNLCAVGGTVKNGTIEIQGDFADKISNYLSQKKYKVKKQGI